MQQENSEVASVRLNASNLTGQNIPVLILMQKLNSKDLVHILISVSSSSEFCLILYQTYVIIPLCCFPPQSFLAVFNSASGGEKGTFKVQLTSETQTIAVTSASIPLDGIVI